MSVRGDLGFPPRWGGCKHTFITFHWRLVFRPGRCLKASSGRASTNQIRRPGRRGSAAPSTRATTLRNLWIEASWTSQIRTKSTASSPRAPRKVSNTSNVSYVSVFSAFALAQQELKCMKSEVLKPRCDLHVYI